MGGSHPSLCWCNILSWSILHLMALRWPSSTHKAPMSFDFLRWWLVSLKVNAGYIGVITHQLFLDQDFGWIINSFETSGISWIESHSTEWRKVSCICIICPTCDIMNNNDNNSSNNGNKDNYNEKYNKTCDLIIIIMKRSNESIFFLDPTSIRLQ